MMCVDNTCTPIPAASSIYIPFSLSSPIPQIPRPPLTGAPPIAAVTMTPKPAAEAAFPGSVRKRTAASPPAISSKRYRSLAEIMLNSKTAPSITGEYYNDVRCEECRSGDREDELVLCDRCDRGFHLFCLRPISARVPTGAWFCPSCAGNKPSERFPLQQTKIVDFFRIQKCDAEQAGKCKQAGKCRMLRDGTRRRKRTTIAFYKKKRRFLPFTPTYDPKRRLEQMHSLATALTELQLEFSNDLTYKPNMAPKSANNAYLEKGGMQVMCREDKEVIQLCRTMYKRGECPPLVVVFDSLEGYTVQADGYIKDMTFITEYVGDVDYLKKREHDDCDSMMTLLLTENSSQDLVICPDKRGNIARFINGINNHTLAGRKKQNLNCVRYNVDGESRVFLVACRDIPPGERLYYNYNGSEQEYPTHHFV